MPGEITFQMTEDDYVAANYGWAFRGWRRPAALSNHAIFWLLPVAGALVLLASIPQTAWLGTGILYLFAIIGGGSLAGYASCRLIGRILLPGRARRLFRQQKSLHLPVTFGWSPNGLFWRNDQAAGTTPWTDLHGWRAGRTTYLFLINEQMFYFIPRRLLADDQSADLEATALAGATPAG